MTKKAVILLSGGLDSATCLAIAKNQGYDCYALSVNYGQKQQSELAAAKRVCDYFKVIEHRFVQISVGAFTKSALTDADIAVPSFDKVDHDHIPATYVPARNTVFLSIALSMAESIDASAIFIGANAVDYSGYPDCRPDYFAAFEKLALLATAAGINGKTISIETPLLHLSKSDIIKTGHALGINYAITVSCYRADENGLACGECDACTFRKKGFDEALIADPTHYSQQ